jgi:hypothetical protein
MSRLSIEITEQQHQQIKAMAAISGLSIKDYIIEKTLHEESYSKEELAALEQLKEAILPSLKAVERGEYSSYTREEILKQLRSKHNKK